MFIGHFAVGLGAKRAAPTVSLGALFLACQLADVVWPTLVLIGVERVAIDPGNTAFTPLNFIAYPYSHSLVALLLWGTLAAGVCLVATRALRPALVIAVLVLSHWILDVITHRPDMPVTISGATRLGWGLWNSVPATVVVETAMFVAGLALYAGATRARDRIGARAFWGLIAVLAVIDVANIVGPPPRSATAVAWSAQLIWFLVLWAFWVDRHRVARATTRTGGAPATRPL